jgi:hypothetical protein
VVEVLVGEEGDHGRAACRASNFAFSPS